MTLHPITESEWDATRWPNFSPAEFRCSHTGKMLMDTAFLDKLQMMRTACGFPFTLTSAYRHPSHPVEANKARPGTHTMGLAADIAATDGRTRDKILESAYLIGMTGKGIHKSFIHVDLAGRDYHGARPVLWLY